jgi:hypothetical protein
VPVAPAGTVPPTAEPYPQTAPPPQPPAAVPAAPPVATAPPPGYAYPPGTQYPQPEAPPAPEQAGKRGPCALDEFCFGPVGTLGIANLLGIGAHARYGNYFGFGIDYQLTPTVGIEDVDVNVSLLTIDARVYPSGGALFLSAGFAYQSLSAETSMNYNGVIINATGDAGVPMLKFGIGLIGHDGFVMGIDAALEVPLSSVHVTLDSTKPTDPAALAQYDMLKKDIESAADDVLNILPFLVQLNLIRVGYMF